MNTKTASRTVKAALDAQFLTGREVVLVLRSGRQVAGKVLAVDRYNLLIATSMYGAVLIPKHAVDLARYPREAASSSGPSEGGNG